MFPPTSLRMVHRIGREIHRDDERGHTRRWVQALIGPPNTKPWIQTIGAEPSSASSYSTKKTTCTEALTLLTGVPHDETAIADAEVDHVKKEGTLHYIRFQLEGSNEYLLIATSRPC